MFIKAANACGNNEGGIPGGNKKAKYRSFASFLRRSSLNCTQSGAKRGLSIDVNAALSGSHTVEWEGGSRLETAACVLKRRSAV